MKLLERVLSKRKRIQFVLFLMYVGFMLWMTLFSRTPYPHRVFRPELFWEIRSMLAGEESGKLLTLLFLENILFFIPFGFLYPGKKNIRHVCAAGLFMSVAIELMQLLTLLGECELDDVISNTFGAFIGVCLYQVAKKYWKDKEKNRVKN